MQIGVAAVARPIQPGLAIQPEPAKRRQTRDKTGGEQIVVHPAAQMDHRRAGPDAEHQIARIGDEKCGTYRTGDGVLHAAAGERVGAPFGQLGDPQAGEHRKQQHGRVDEAVFLVGDAGMHRDDRQRGGEQYR